MVAENDPSGLAGYAHELGDRIPSGVSNEILKLAFFSHRRLVEQPDERLEVHGHRRVQCFSDDAKSETVLETFPMSIKGIFDTLQPLSELALSQ